MTATATGGRLAPGGTERASASPTLLRTRAIAVLRAPHAREYAPVVEALATGGVLSVELTLSTPGVVEELPALLERFGDTVEFGVGTVTTPDEVEAVVDAGAAYIVTPITVPAIIRSAVARGVPVYPGGLTPTELFAGWALGATAVKVFPASQVGPGYIADLRGPFPGIQVVPSGGVGIQDIGSWIRAGALAVSLGGPLIGDAFKGGDLGALTDRAQRVREEIELASGS